MRFEPDLDRQAILRDLRGVYGIRAEALMFVPASSYAACYEVICGAGRYFLKVWPQAEKIPLFQDSRRTSLEVMQALHGRDLGVLVPRPVMTTTGAFLGELGGMPSVVTTWLPGKRPAATRTRAFARELGRTVGASHLATTAVKDIALPHEELEIAFATSLPQDMMAAVADATDGRPGLHLLATWAERRQAEVMSQVERLQELRSAAGEITRPLVFCHTDLHDSNLLVDDEGRIGVVDWEDAKLAPREHDLWAGLGEDHRGESFPAFLDGYLTKTGLRVEEAVSWKHLSFYLLRRYLEDTTFLLRGLLGQDGDEREDNRRLQGLEQCRERWLRLDETLSGVRRAVRDQRLG